MQWDSLPKACDISKYWILTALEDMIVKGSQDTRTLFKIIKAYSSEQPCHDQTTHMTSPASHCYQVLDPNTNKPIPNVMFCELCMRCVFELWPNLIRKFVKAAMPTPWICDFQMQSRRGFQYVAKLLNNQVEYTWEVDLREFIEFARTRSMLDECVRKETVRGVACYGVAKIPSLAICKECYHDGVAPNLVEESSFAAEIELESRVRDAGFECQLYSVRMRQVFKEAAANDDIGFLRTRVHERTNRRRAIERETEVLAATCTSQRNLAGLMDSMAQSCGIRGAMLSGSSNDVGTNQHLHGSWLQSGLRADDDRPPPSMHKQIRAGVRQ
jgi:hypothetical protein